MRVEMAMAMEALVVGMLLAEMRCLLGAAFWPRHACRLQWNHQAALGPMQLWWRPPGGHMGGLRPTSNLRRSSALAINLLIHSLVLEIAKSCHASVITNGGGS